MPANIGYLSGELKHFFDTVFYVCADDTAARPFGLYGHGDLGTWGPVRAVETVTDRLGWRQVAAHVEVTGPPSRTDLDACAELGATPSVTAAEAGG